MVVVILSGGGGGGYYSVPGPCMCSCSNSCAPVQYKLYTVPPLSPQVVVVEETGNGESTQILLFLMEAGYADSAGQMIGVTEPWRVAATTLAARVEKSSRLGAAVGFSIR